MVHSAGQPRFVRTVGKLGGRFITGELQQKFGWSYEEAEVAKAQYGLPRQRPAGDDLVTLDHPAQQAIAERANAVVAEVRTTLNFFLSASTGISGLSRIVLTGGGASLPGFAERIGEGLKVEISTLPAPPDMRLDGPAAGQPANAGNADAGNAAAAGSGAPSGAAGGTTGASGPAYTTGLALLAGLALGMA